MKTKNFLKIIRKNLGFAALIISLFSIRWSVADHYVVPTGSMLPTIQLGDHIVVNKLAYSLRFPFTNISLTQFANPKRGEIVVFDHPESKINMVKRVAAVPGDVIEIKNGHVYINNRFEAFVPNGSDSSFNTSNHSYIVPADRYFVLGDNRSNSFDSRFWGYVPRDLIKGRAFMVAFNLSLPSRIIHNL